MEVRLYSHQFCAMSLLFYIIKLELICYVHLYMLLLSCSVMSNSFVTPQPVAHQGLCPRDLPDKNTGVGCHFLLQEIFLTQGSNLHLLHLQADSLLLSYQGSSNLYILHLIF